MNLALDNQLVLPGPLAEEDPVAFADRLGREYGATISKDHRKTYGHYLTPPAIARYMGGLCTVESATVRLIDPAAGAGVLAVAACVALAGQQQKPARIELVVYELDARLGPYLAASLQYIEAWLSMRGISLVHRALQRDFVLENAGALEGGIFPPEEVEPFDAVICNPPYFKIPKADPRARACATVVHGQPNIYGLFMAVSATLLKPSGRLVFITPRSFASGPYFQRFREVFFEAIRPEIIHVFESRTEAFASVLQETIILSGRREERWNHGDIQHSVRISVSEGATDIECADTRALPVGEILRGDCKHRVLHLPANAEHDRVRAVVHGWTGKLHAYGFEISTGPVVPFRAQQYLVDVPSNNTVPMLWMHHVSPMSVVWPKSTRKAQQVRVCPESQSIVLPNRNYVLLRRFSAKEEARRLTAAPFLADRFQAVTQVGIENHLNYIHKPGGELTHDEAWGLAALLSSQLMDTYFRISNGNTQVSATELRATPLPPIETIRGVGRQVLARGVEHLEVILEQELLRGDA